MHFCSSECSMSRECILVSSTMFVWGMLLWGMSCLVTCQHLYFAIAGLMYHVYKWQLMIHCCIIIDGVVLIELITCTIVCMSGSDIDIISYMHWLMQGLLWLVAAVLIKLLFTCIHNAVSFNENLIYSLEQAKSYVICCVSFFQRKASNEIAILLNF